MVLDRIGRAGQPAVARAGGGRMGFVGRNLWALVGGSGAICVASLALGQGLPATIAGLVFGGLLMWSEVQRAPAVTEE